MSHLSSFDRRQFLRAAGLTGLGAAGLVTLAACGGSGDDAGGSTGWSFKDDRGKTVETAQSPKNVVAQVTAAAALWDFGVRPTGIFGPSKLDSGENDPQVGNVDLTKVTSVGAEFNDFNIEQYAGLNPDLLVSIMYLADKSLWYVPVDTTDQILDIAPSVGINGLGVTVKEVIERFGVLAEALGADLSADAVTTPKADFEAAGEELSQTVKDKAGLKVMAISSSDQLFYIGTPEQFPDLKYFYTDLGMDFFVPEEISDAGYWMEVSWEQAASYQADVILYDARTGSLTPEHLAATQPTWNLLPAVKANQLVPWSSEAPFSYSVYAEKMRTISDQLKTFDPAVV